MEKSKNTKIWVVVKRTDLIEDNKKDAPTQLENILIPQNVSSEVVHKVFTEMLNLPLNSVVLKMRNPRGSLIPLNCRILSNSKSVPYTLEITREHQFIMAQSKETRHQKYKNTLSKVLQEFIERLNNIEEKMPELNNRHHEKIVQDMNFLDCKVKFLNTRFDEAEKTKWVGMFKKNPMW